jgi:hypothetical protein
MISSRRGLAILSALAAILLAATLLDLLRTAAPSSRALVPSFAADQVTELVWMRPATPEVQLTRTSPAARWLWQDPPGWADPRTVDDVLAALRGARWHRRAAAATAVRATLFVHGAAGVLEKLALGEPLAGAGQTWLVDGDHQLLVDDWVARALFPPPLALRVRTPLARADAASSIELSGTLLGLDVRLDGNPRRLVRPRQLRVATSHVRALEQALASLAIVRLPDSPIANATGVHVRLAGVPGGELTEAGSCPGATGAIAVTGPAGDGCVDADAWKAVLAAAFAFTGDPELVIDQRPAALDLSRVTLADGAVLELAVHPTIRLAAARGAPAAAAVDADPTRVAALLAALAAPADVVPLPVAAPSRALVLIARDGTQLVLDVYGDGIVARRGEPVGLRVGGDALARLVAAGTRFVQPMLWAEEPTTIDSIAIDGATWRRGAVIGEWFRAPQGRNPRADPILERLAAALAAPHPLAGAPPATFTAAHTVVLSIRRPGAADTAPLVEHRAELAAPIAAGCPLRTGSTIVVVDVAVCTDVASLR